MFRSIYSAVFAVSVLCIVGQSSCISGNIPAAIGQEANDGDSRGETGDTGTGSDPTTKPLPDGSTTTLPSQIPFEAPSRMAAAHKIKVILLGLRATSQELKNAKDDIGFERLVDTWLADPNSEATMLRFFSWATQQSQTGRPNLPGQFDSGVISPVLMSQVLEQFGRTALWMVKNNTPFNQIASTSTFMVTPRLLAAYSYAETRRTYDNESVHDIIYEASGKKGFGMTTKASIPLSRSIDPQDPDYLILTVPKLEAQSCIYPVPDPYFQGSKGLYQPVCSIFYEGLINGRGHMGQVFYDQNGQNGSLCQLESGLTSVLPAAQADLWRPVTLKRPAAGQRVNMFWDINALLTADTFVLATPRVGFWSTLSFFGQWETNINNQMRTTINQAFIAGLGKAFDGSDQTEPKTLDLIPAEHAVKGTTCYACHLTMDPMRQIFRKAFTTHYDPQEDPNLNKVNGQWAQDGVSQVIDDIAQFGDLMAASPVFAIGWTKKVCSWLNSSPCSESDPLLKAIAAEFQASNFSFKTMFKRVLLSPLVTYQQTSETASQEGTVMTMARRDQLCSVLSQRLNIDDFCLLSPASVGSANRKNVSQMALYYPSDAYSRNAVEPIMVSQPTMPSRMGLETLCGYAAIEVVGAQAQAIFSSSNPAAAVDKIATVLMGLGDDERQTFSPVLRGHYEDSVAAGSSVLDALRSTFVLACLSPQVSMIGLD